MKFLGFFLLILAITIMAPKAEGGMLAYGICQTGCNKVAVACYAAGGGVMGTLTLGLGAIGSFAACSAAQGACMSSCIAAGAAPVP